MTHAIDDIVGHRFQDQRLIEQALSHPSLPGPVNYQRLEFLGDRVLGLVVAAWLYERYPGEAEGELNRRYTALVRRETLAEVAQGLGLDAHIRGEASADAAGLRQQPAVLADVCEAVIGALYLDAGLEVAAEFIHRHWQARLNGPATLKDAKTALQEWAQAHRLPLPTYQVADRTGPDHSPEFTVTVAVVDHGEETASGPSKRAAQQAAAQRMLDRLVGELGP